MLEILHFIQVKMLLLIIFDINNDNNHTKLVIIPPKTKIINIQIIMRFHLLDVIFRYVPGRPVLHVQCFNCCFS